MSDLMSAVGLLVGVWSLAMLTAHPGGDRTHPDDVLEAELNRLATNVVRSAARAKRPLTLVSVLAFEERGRGPTQAGEYVADLFDEILAKKNINRVARNPSSERAMWSELCHSTEGHTSDATAVSIGKRQAARYVIHGIMTKLNDRWRVRAKVLHVESSRVIVNQSVKVPGAAFGDHLLAPLDPRITDCVGTDEASTSIVRSTNRGGGQNGDGSASELNSQREPRPPITLEVGVIDKHSNELFVVGERWQDALDNEALFEALDALGGREEDLRHPACADAILQDVVSEGGGLKLEHSGPQRGATAGTYYHSSRRRRCVSGDSASLARGRYSRLAPLECG